jgi:CheY-like chemotaxis protein
MAMLADFQPDVALVDIGLPGLDGYEIARRVRKLPSGKRIKLIALTGYGGLEDRERAENSGFDMHLTKPVSYEQLVRALDAQRHAAHEG